MNNKCLYCYEFLDVEKDFHKKCCLEFFGTKTPPKTPYSLNQMADLAKNVVERSIAVPGVQAKLSMSLVKETQDNLDNRLTVIGALQGQYIFKPPSAQFIEMPKNEHVTMRIAEAFGIRVVLSSLIRLKSGELSYITKRIDRAKNGEKIHMLDMFQITEAFDKYKSSMEKIGKAIHNYSSNTLLDKIFYFELVVFSFLTGNNDMHLKNFSMIESVSGWVLAPAYDLLNVNIVNPEDDEELALTLEGKKKKLKWEHFERLGKGLELTDKQIQAVFNRMIKYKPKAIEWIDKSFLSKEMKKKYSELILERYKRLSE
ncbi:MAG: HipA domain-containing protein [Flavobacteriaceae bacterium]|nr:HipA domain-containing protein [Flavobacteriaceae bacterium]